MAEKEKKTKEQKTEDRTDDQSTDSTAQDAESGAGTEDSGEGNAGRHARPDAETVETIIRAHVGFSMVAGAIPVPLVDLVAVTAIQMDMPRKLAAAYELDFNEERGKSLVTSIMGATLGTLVGRGVASAVKVVPGVGTLLGIGSQVVFAGASTYALGKIFQSHFDNEGTLGDFKVDAMKERFRGFMDKGRKVARDMHARSSRTDILATIEKLKALKDSGAITEEEFEASKKDLLAKLAR